MCVCVCDLKQEQNNLIHINFKHNEYTIQSVSYTHLDVYKRQVRVHVGLFMVLYGNENEDIVRSY